jgi:bifunctional DNA-binding transcriptional regulator/antitoxin component of YhaV-PrlF toxin-antitoxin module
MVKFKVRASPSGQYYFPKEVRQELGEDLELICDAKAGIIYNSKTGIRQILKSMEIIQKELEHRLELEQTEEREVNNP